MFHVVNKVITSFRSKTAECEKNKEAPETSELQKKFKRAKSLVDGFSHSLETGEVGPAECCLDSLNGKRITVSPFYVGFGYSKAETEEAFVYFIMFTPDPVQAVIAKGILEEQVSRLVPDWMGDAGNGSEIEYHFRIVKKEKERVSELVRLVVDKRKKIYGDNLDALGSMKMSELMKMPIKS